jgi:hypothetical protein
MMPGILILLPVSWFFLIDWAPQLMIALQAGLSVVGGLSANFHSPSSSVMSWLTTGLSMVQGKSLVSPRPSDSQRLTDAEKWK